MLHGIGTRLETTASEPATTSSRKLVSSSSQRRLARRLHAQQPATCCELGGPRQAKWSQAPLGVHETEEQRTGQTAIGSGREAQTAGVSAGPRDREEKR